MASPPPTPTSPAILAPYHFSTASTSAQNDQAQKRERRKLPKEATTILSNFFREVTDNPCYEQRTELLEQIHRFPGTEWYDGTHMYNYFAQKRKGKEKATTTTTSAEPAKRGRKRKADAAEQRSTDSILWPSLTPKTVEKLEILLSDYPDATNGHYEIWARALGVVAGDIRNWVDMHRLRVANGLTKEDTRTDADGRKRTKSSLPTPEPTASPEPQYRHIVATPSLTSPIASSSNTYTETYVHYGMPSTATTQSGGFPMFQASIVSVGPVGHSASPAATVTQYSTPSPAAQQRRMSTPASDRGTSAESTPPVPAAALKPKFASPITSDALASFRLRSTVILPESSGEPSTTSHESAAAIATKATKPKPPPLPRLKLLNRGSTIPAPSSAVSRGSIPPPSPATLASRQTSPALTVVVAATDTSSATALSSRLDTRGPSAGPMVPDVVQDFCISFMERIRSMTPSPPLDPTSGVDVNAYLARAFKFSEDIGNGVYASLGLMYPDSDDGDGVAPMDTSD